jgi:hypothetical protein
MPQDGGGGADGTFTPPGRNRGVAPIRHPFKNDFDRMTGNPPPIPGRSLAEQGLTLPPRRGFETVQAAKPSAPAPAADASVSLALSRLLRPQSAYRWLLPSVAAITPQYIESTLRGALAGNHVQAWELFDLMRDTWPELSAVCQELTTAVAARALVCEPYAEDGEDPDEDSLRRCRVVNAALRRLKPDVTRDENGLPGIIADIMDSWFVGQSVQEILWSESADDETLRTIRCGDIGMIIVPRSACWVHPVCYAWDVNGRLGLRLSLTQPGALSPGVWQNTSRQPRPTEVRQFPEHKFLIAIHKQKAGTPLSGALLRVLAWWWCAANFSADWLLNLAQLFGLPFRWANYSSTAPQGTIDSVCSMLENMGSAGWAAFPEGTTLELKDTGKTGDNSPQGNLLDRADRYARMVVLGQTMSGGQDASKGGGKAFGQVEQDVKGQRINAAAGFSADVLGQLRDAVLTLNFGDADMAPTLCLQDREYADLNEAQRDAVLITAGLKVGEDWMRRKYDIPAPGEGEEVVGKPPAPAPPAFAAPPAAEAEAEDEVEEEEDEEAPIKARESAPPTDSFQQAATAHFAAALARDMESVRALILSLDSITDDAEFVKRAVEVRDELDKLRAQLTELPESARALAEAQVAAFFNGLLPT